MGPATNATADSEDSGPETPDEPLVDDATEPSADDAWAASLRAVFHQVIESLPDHATLGDLVDAARSNRAVAPVLEIFTVGELIDIAKARPKPAPASAAPPDPLGLDAGPRVIRRRADVPDGDLRVLRCLSNKGPQREADLAQQTKLTAEQLRIILRHLRTKGYIHVEGSGAKRKLKITRNGGGFLRRQSPAAE